MAKSETQLSDIVSRIVGQRCGAPSISPRSIANDAMEELDPERTIEVEFPLVWLGCNLAFRQIARGQLAGRFDPNDKSSSQGELFRGLQDRYPVAHEGDDARYVRRDIMSAADVAYNVERLRKEGKAKLAHADALQAWADNRLSAA